MLKKTLITVYSFLLCFLLTHADDSTIKKVDNEKLELLKIDSKYIFPSKITDELSNDEIKSICSYLKGYTFNNEIIQNKGFDSDAFLTGIEEKINSKDTAFDKLAWDRIQMEFDNLLIFEKPITKDFLKNYYKNYGQFVANDLMETKIDLKNFMQGFKDKKENKKISIEPEIITSLLEKFKDSQDTKSINKKFLEKNKNKPGVITLPSGLQYKIINNSNLTIPTEEETIKVHYVATTIDGNEFDSSIKRGQPIEVTSPRQVIKGWVEILKLMPKGSKWQVFIPCDLAYGDKGVPGAIEPYSTLIFEMEILEN